MYKGCFQKPPVCHWTFKDPTILFSQAWRLCLPQTGLAFCLDIGGGRFFLSSYGDSSLQQLQLSHHLDSCYVCAFPLQETCRTRATHSHLLLQTNQQANMKTPAMNLLEPQQVPKMNMHLLQMTAWQMYQMMCLTPTPVASVSWFSTACRDMSNTSCPRTIAK